MDQKKREILAGVLSAIILLTALILGETREKNYKEVEFLDGSAGTVNERVNEPDEPALSEQQLRAMKELEGAFRSGRGDDIARILDRKQDVFVRIFYDSLNGERWMFDGEHFSQEIEGDGLVLTLPSTAFYGEFHNGKPDGAVTALQFVNVDSPRYNYSRGLWKNGRMEGDGVTGYCYYETIPSGEHKRTEKSGQFEDNRLEGVFGYKIVEGDGSLSQWTMTANQGVLLLDERWKHLEKEKEYQLTADNKEGHAYILGEEQVSLPAWENLILWDEME